MVVALVALLFNARPLIWRVRSRRQPAVGTMRSFQKKPCQTIPSVRISFLIFWPEEITLSVVTFSTMGVGELLPYQVNGRVPEMLRGLFGA